MSKINVINFNLLTKYTDLNDDELEMARTNNNSYVNIESLGRALERTIKIDPKLYNPKLNQWNMHNMPVEDMYNFVGISNYFFSSRMLDDIYAFDSELWKQARWLQEQPIKFDGQHSYECHHYHNEKDFCLSYKELKTGDQVKTGKVIKMFKKLPWFKKMDESVFVKFNNFLKGRYNSNIDIREVKGEEIREWYHHDKISHVNTGSLKESCMRHSSCQPYFDIYTENDCRMIIATQGDKLVGRAIIWPRDLWNKNYFDNATAIVDRIYGVEATIEQVKLYCKEKQYVHKARQSYQNPYAWVHYHDEFGNKVEKDKKVRINLRVDFEQYPYMDTFKYAAEGRVGYICNFEPENYDYELTETNGYTNRGCECNDCGTNVSDDDSINVNDEYYCRECVNFVSSHDEYYMPDDTVWSDNEDSYLHNDDAVEIEAEGDWAHRENVLESINHEHVSDENAVRSYIDSDETVIFVYKDSNYVKTMVINDIVYTYSTNMQVDWAIEFFSYVCGEIYTRADSNCTLSNRISAEIAVSAKNVMMEVAEQFDNTSDLRNLIINRSLIDITQTNA